MRRGTHKLAAALGMALLCAGCGGGQATISQWQREVEQFVTTRGRGDPNAVREAVRTSAPPVFAVHGGEDPARSTDAVGLLMGQESIGGKPATIFLVALVAKGQVEDIRIAALSGAGGALSWRVGSADDRALLAYRGGGRGGSVRRTAGGKSDVPEHPPWPARDDVFELAVTPAAITVTERRSGANWVLPLTAG